MKRWLITTIVLLAFAIIAPRVVYSAPLPPPPPPIVCGEVGLTCCPGDTCPGSGVCFAGSCITGAGTDLPVKNGPPIVDGCIETAIGCIPVESEDALAKFFLRWGMGLGGGIALIIMTISTYMIMTSAGDPRKLQAGKELLTSAIAGLLLLVFSAWLLNFIGVELLQIF